MSYPKKLFVQELDLDGESPEFVAYTDSEKMIPESEDGETFAIYELVSTGHVEETKVARIDDGKRPGRPRKS